MAGSGAKASTGSTERQEVSENEKTSVHAPVSDPVRRFCLAGGEDGEQPLSSPYYLIIGSDSPDGRTAWTVVSKRGNTLAEGAEDPYRGAPVLAFLGGDVIGLTPRGGNANWCTFFDVGRELISEPYDAWGKPTGKTGTMASTLGTVQPFRYRGYVWDEETELYYLRSRYYRPEWCRFLSADELLIANIYSYCINNPIRNNDPTGKLPTVEDVKMAYSSLGSLFLSIKGYEISKACYQHFLMGHGEPLNDDLLRKIGDTVSESVPFRDRILKNAPSGKRFWIDIPKKPIEMQGDLYYSLQHITPVSICYRTQGAIIGISFFTDEYDFVYRSEIDEPDFFKRTVNNECGYALQENGYGTNYTIEVVFAFYIPLE